MLIVGDAHSEIHEKPLCQGFISLGHEAEVFGWSGYLQKKGLAGILARAQNRYKLGEIINKINSDLLVRVAEFAPEMIFFYRPTLILPETLVYLKNLKVKLFCFNNDDPFSHRYRSHEWKVFREGLRFYDHIFCYRQKNIEDLSILGFRNISILRSFYMSGRNYPLDNILPNQFTSDVSFIGHFENDGRDEILYRLCEEGVKLKIFGPEWKRSPRYNYFVQKCGPIIYLKDDYNLALNSAKILLVFYSKLNNDSYTRRCFELPASQAFMLSERTEDMMSMFKEGEEIDYFDNADEAVAKINYYLAHDDKRLQMSKNALLRLKKDGHEVKDRVLQIISTYSMLKG